MSAVLTGTRNNPIEMRTLNSAQELAIKKQTHVWVIIYAQRGKFKVYPGGRVIHYA